jgi:SEC-C motif-containing protein
MIKIVPCPCGSGREYPLCCEVFHSGTSSFDNAEQVVRARFSAFVLRNIPFLTRTFCPKNRPENYTRELLQTFRETRWTNLNILGRKENPDTKNDALVEYSASFLQKNSSGNFTSPSETLHEIAFFRVLNGTWYYCEGILQPAQLPTNNQPCWCGSDKKYKRCHLKTDLLLQEQS